MINDLGYNDCMFGLDYDTEEECSDAISTYSGYSCKLVKMYFDPKLSTYHKEAFKIWRPYYIKLKVEKSIIKEAYVCIEVDDETYCMKGADRNAYDDNIRILKAVESHFRICSYEDYNSVCQGGSPLLHTITFADPAAIVVSTDNGAGCWGGSDGSIRIYD